MSSEPPAMLGIGALSRASGVPVETLRTWERRYGFPQPARTPSGHRLYAVACVPRLRRIAEALARGVRASQAVGASDEGLSALLRAYGKTDDLPPAVASVAAGPVPAVAELLGMVQRYDGAGLHRTLVAAWGRLGPVEFVRSCVGPLVVGIGTAWEQGAIEIRQEHFASERVSDLLRVLRLPYEERARGPLVLLATLPGESHALGLQMAALLLATGGCRVLLLGPQAPPAEIAALAADTGAHAVGISVSADTAGGATAREIGRLRRTLPGRVRLLVGGVGAPRAGTDVANLADPAALDAWARRAVSDDAA